MIVKTYKLCPAEGCPLKESCVRFKPEEKLKHSDFFSTPFNNFTESCKYYIKLESNDNTTDHK